MSRNQYSFHINGRHLHSWCHRRSHIVSECTIFRHSVRTPYYSHYDTKLNRGEKLAVAETQTKLHGFAAIYDISPSKIPSRSVHNRHIHIHKEKHPRGVVYKLLRLTVLSYTNYKFILSRQAFSVTPEVHCHLFITCSMTQQCLWKYLLENKHWIHSIKLISMYC